MQKVKGRDTKPEMTVRQLLHGLGYRYRLHVKELSGSPDLVFSSRKSVIFVHGCYWHGHDCKYGKLSKSNVPFWAEKITKNRLRDSKNLEELADNSWKALVLWQCQLKDMETVTRMLVEFLGKPGKKASDKPSANR
jgi:DNA mismatch endonuclease (patch repair protein)